VEDKPATNKSIITNEVPLIKQLKDSKYKLKIEINEANRLHQSIKISSNPDKKKLHLLTDMIIE